MLGYKQDPLPEEHAIDEFFKFGSQYYVAGRYRMFAGFMPVAANLHHHAIEMLLNAISPATIPVLQMASR
jgi:hypothetical protein